MRPYVEQTLARMGAVPVEEYYGLCNRLDTLEHVHEVLVAVAAQMMGEAADPDPEAGDPPDDIPVPVADEPSGLSLIHISEPTRRTPISYAVFCLKKKKQ